MTQKKSKLKLNERVKDAVTVDVYSIVQNSRRRALLKILRDLGGESCLREIVRRIAENEGDLDSDKRLLKSVHVSLLQTHLPKMESAGLIQYDRVTSTVHLLELPSEFRYYLEIVEKHDIPWSLYYLILSGLGVGFSMFLGNFLAIVLSLCFLTAALVHTYQTRGVTGMVNDSLTKVKHKLTKWLNSNNKSIKKREE